MPKVGTNGGTAVIKRENGGSMKRVMTIKYAKPAGSKPALPRVLPRTSTQQKWGWWISPAHSKSITTYTRSSVLSCGPVPFHELRNSFSTNPAS